MGDHVLVENIELVRNRSLFRCRNLETPRFLQLGKISNVNRLVLLGSCAAGTLIFGIITGVHAVGQEIVVSLCLITIGVGCLCTIAYLKSKSFIQDRGLLAILPNVAQDAVKEFLLKRSFYDLMTGFESESFTKLSDLLISFTLPMTPKERRAIFRTLPKKLRRQLRRKGVVFNFPKSLQNLLLSETELEENRLFVGRSSRTRSKRPILPDPTLPRVAMDENRNGNSLLTEENVERFCEINEGEEVVDIRQELAKRRRRLSFSGRNTDLIGNSLGSNCRMSQAQSTLSAIPSVGSFIGIRPADPNAPIFSEVMDRRMADFSFKVMRNAWRRPFEGVSDKHLAFVSAGATGICIYFILKSPKLKKALKKFGFYGFILLLAVTGGLPIIELLVRQGGDILKKLPFRTYSGNGQSKKGRRRRFN